MVKQTPSSTSLLVVVAFHLAVISATYTVPVWVHDCDDVNGNYTSNSPYKENLDYLLIDMITTISESGFYNSSLRHTPDVVYLKSLCTGNFPVDDCRQCLASLSDEIITEYCPNQKSVVFWSEDCMIRYSSISLFGIVETHPNYTLETVNAGTIGLLEEERYKRVVQGMIADFPSSVSNGNSSLKYATREANFSSSITIYSAAQCTPDLTPADCFHCLTITTAVNQLESAASSEISVRTLYPSCNVRYDEEKFYLLNAGAPSPTITPNSTKKGSTRAKKMIVVVVIVIVGFIGFILVASIASFIFAKKKRKSVLESAY